MDFNPSDWGSALGVSGGWLFGILIVLGSLWFWGSGRIVSSKTMETMLRVKEESLQVELEARQLWQKAAMDQLAINDLERETSRRIGTAVEATLKVVSDLQAANEARYRYLGGERREFPSSPPQH